jgi:hypothetical protein
MSSEQTCPDCTVPLERMTLQGTEALGELSIVSESSDGGFLGSLQADEILSPVPYVCPECGRTLLYAES